MQKVADAHVTARQRVVGNWATKIGFASMVGVGQKVIQFVIYVREPGFPRSLWKWLDKTGVKARPNWRSKSGKPFAFKWAGPGSYRSKTSPSPARYGGPGDVPNGQDHVFHVVNWPGFPPRHFSLDINADLEPYMEREIRNGLRHGFSRALKH